MQPEHGLLHFDPAEQALGLPASAPEQDAPCLQEVVEARLTDMHTAMEEARHGPIRGTQGGGEAVRAAIGVLTMTHGQLAELTGNSSTDGVRTVEAYLRRLAAG